MNLKTISGRFSRTKIAAYVGILLQLLTAILGLFEILDAESWAGIATALGIIQGWLKSILRDMTYEPIDKPGVSGPGTTALVVMMIWGMLFIGCVSTCTVPEIIAQPWEGHPLPAGTLKLKCGDKTWDIDVEYAPKECIESFSRCMTPPNGWKPPKAD